MKSEARGHDAKRPPEGLQRPRKPVKSAFITRSNNPLKQPEKSAGDIKGQKEETEGQVRLPDYLALLVNLVSYPVGFVCKAYSATCFILSLPSKAVECGRKVARWPSQCLEKAAQIPLRLLVWVQNNIEGLALLCSEHQHIGGLCILAGAFWLCPLPAMTYPLFALLRLVLGTLYPAYASYKAVSTKNVREYVSILVYR